MPKLTFTLGDGKQIVVDNAPLAGKLELAQTNGAPVRMAYDLTKTATYSQSHVGSLRGAERFTLAAALQRGWRREGLTVYRDGAAVPDYYTHTEADPWTICMGSATFEKQFLAQNKGVKGGVNLAQKGYKVNDIRPSKYGGNDIFAVRRGADGRLYTAILYNDDAYPLPGDPSAVFNAPCLFYSDDDGANWCYFWSPPRAAWPAAAGYRIWNGDFWIFSRKTEILGKVFEVGNVLWVLCNFRPNGSAGARIDYLIQPTTAAAPTEHGTLIGNDDGRFAGDPRFIVSPEEGVLDFVCNSNITGTKQSSYERFTMRSWAANDFNGRLFLRQIAKAPSKGRWNYEVPCPVFGQRLFFCNIQIVALDATTWNSIINATVIVDDGNINHYQTIDIGYDSYALGNGDNKLMLTVMNWGANNYGMVASYPPRPFSIIGNKLRFDTAGFAPIDALHSWKCGGVEFFALRNNNLKLEGVPIKPDYLTWGAKWASQSHHAESSLPDISDVKQVYYRIDRFMLYLIIKCGSGHDRLCNVYCTRGDITP